MRRRTPYTMFVAIVAAATIATALHADAATPPLRTERLQFARGVASATIKGRLQGDQTVDYRVGAGAGQTLTVTLKASNPQNYFNVLPPRSANVAMFVGQDGGYKGMLPTDGDDTVRVYLMRPAARRNETSNYTLTIGVTGKALPPLAASTDALIPGTKFHASAQVTCKPPFDPKPQQCEAFVIRRGVDGTATVEVRAPVATTRRILFVAGAPVAVDATEPLTHSRDGDRSVVNFGTDERYEIPDALVRGG